MPGAGRGRGRWNNGKEPYGSWQVQHAWVLANWLDCPVPVVHCSTDPAYDFGFIVLKQLNGPRLDS